MKRLKQILFLLTFVAIFSCYTAQTISKPIVVGVMRNVMWKGDLKSKINFDTLSNKTHLYGIGAVENLKGEIMVVDGQSYVSTVGADSMIVMAETFNVQSPLFGYAYIKSWQETIVPKTVQNIADLDDFLEKSVSKKDKPCFFRITATVDNAKFHVMNLPDGVQVTSPDVEHSLGQKHFVIEQQEVELIGFFSTEHKAIFTHHDTFTHIHLMTKDKKKMGHLDEITFRKGSLKLFFPKS
jgi:acetolactate decarboxylase